MFLPALLQLFSVCRVGGCGGCVDEENILVRQDGAMVRVECVCNNDHRHKTVWESSPMIGSGRQQTSVINILLSVYTLTIGLHIQQVSAFLPFIYNISTKIFPDSGFFLPSSYILFWQELLFQPSGKSIGEDYLVTVAIFSGL